MKKSLFILLFPILMTACVPSALPGSSPSNAISTSEGIPAQQVYPGSTWYFTAEYDPNLFYKHSEVTSIFHTTYFRPEPGLKLSSTVSGFFLRSPKESEGLALSIQRSYLEREVIEANAEFYTATDRLFIVFKVDVPETATRGLKVILATLQRGSVNTSQRIPLTFRVGDVSEK